MNGPNKHSAVISLGKNSIAFVDGIPDKCDHDYTGDVVFQSASGKMIYWHTYRQWASLCSDARNRLIQEYHQKIDDPIVFGAVTCKKCKKVYEPEMF